MTPHHHVTGTLADATAVAAARVAAAAAARAAGAPPSRVAPRVYVGGAASARDGAALTAAAITHIVNAAPSVPNWFEKAGGDENAPPSLSYLNIPVFDDSRDDLGAFFPTVVSFIDTALASGGAVLIHCVAGASRSVTLAAAWLVAARGATPAAALAAVRAARPRAAPNAGFLAQLAAWAATGCVTPPPPPAALLAVTRPSRAASAAVLCAPPRPRSAPLPGSKSAAALAGLPTSDRAGVAASVDDDRGGASDA